MRTPVSPLLHSFIHKKLHKLSISEQNFVTLQTYYVEDNKVKTT